MNNKQKIISRILGLTLIEVLVATSIFTIAFAGLMIGLKSARFATQGALIRFVSTQYAQGLLESIQSYSYEDPSDFPHTGNDISDSSIAFTAHTTTFGSFKESESGVYDNLGSLVEKLKEERIGLKYYSTQITSDASFENPFLRNSALDINDSLIGPEEGDLHPDSDPAGGIYKILESQQKLNTFAYKGVGQEKYFFMDDVDDFDGYKEVRTILPDVQVTFEVSVKGIYDNIEGYDYTINNSNGSIQEANTLSQSKYGPMQEISITNFQTLIPALLTSDDALSQTQQVGYGYYNSMIFKKITIKAYWEFPINSGKINTIIIDGGSVNPRNSAF